MCVGALGHVPSMELEKVSLATSSSPLAPARTA
jgi:hypothetical protein